MNQMKSIRQRSLKIVSELGLPVNRRLPLIDEPKEIRSADEVVNRIFVMHSRIASSYGFEREDGLLWLKQENCLDFLTWDENLFFRTGFVSIAYIEDLISSMWVLAWCINKIDKLDASVPVSDDFVHVMPNLHIMESGDSFRSSAILRPKKEIIEQFDLAYCLHWAAVDLDPHGNKGWHLPVSPAKIAKRRHALEWMTSKEDWNSPQLLDKRFTPSVSLIRSFFSQLRS